VKGYINTAYWSQGLECIRHISRNVQDKKFEIRKNFFPNQQSPWCKFGCNLRKW